MLFFTEWGFLSLENIRRLMREADDKGDFDTRLRLMKVYNTCYDIFLAS